MSEEKKLKVAIVGCGIVGNALKVWIENNNKDVDLRTYDPNKNMKDDISACDAYFVQIPVPTKEDGFLDGTELLKVLVSIPNDVPVFIRSTITPQMYYLFTQYLKDAFKKTTRVYYMPEYLSDRTAVEDFAKQILVCTCDNEKDEETFKAIFTGRDYIKMSSVEAILAKYFHNVFGALKVTYFNCIHDICENSLKNKADYNKVLAGMYVSGHIDKLYTEVPGHDGKLGYGGKCFPKDLKAIERELRYTPFGRLVEPLEKLNFQFRGSQI